MMEGLLIEIRECFASKQSGARKLTTLLPEYPAWSVRLNGEYGVAVPFPSDEIISEYFSDARIRSCKMRIGTDDINVLFLSSTNDGLRHEFATICAQFVDPGEKGIDRINLISVPIDWFKKWRELLGNAVREKKIYSVVGELLVFEHLIKAGKRVEWEGPNSGSHDIEAYDSSHEVKTTIKRYGASITISGQHQLKSSKELYLYFCRLEESALGQSLNQILERLDKLGCDMYDLEMKLSAIGFEKGRVARNIKYKILEKRKYLVDENFPKIVDKSFKEDKFPLGITHIQYTVDLDGLEYTTW